ncbi:MAG: hypothetical protein HXX14_17325 [Bacteroidetes bacterium]|nr:hypothetical protein [Bacteroidota bacterium]
MEKRSLKIRKTLLIVLLVLLVLPAIQYSLALVKLDPLKGAITKPEKVDFTLKDWFSGSFQEQEEKYINESFGFRSLFVRINNQLMFNLFKKAKAKGVVIGKNGYLFEEHYINAYYGSDFVGVDSIKHRMDRLKYIQDRLSKLNKTLLIVFAPGKASFYPEYIPENMKTAKKITNYQQTLNTVKSLGINHIDFNQYFINHKNIAQYPLYPKYGIHWSYYGSCLAADSIEKYIERIRKIDMPNISWKYVKMAEAKESDYDIGDGMNLLFKLKGEKLAYPLLQFEKGTDKTKPSLLVISDSFYWGMYSFGFTKVFSKNHFWYYNKDVYPDCTERPLKASQLNLKDQIMQHDVIMIMSTETTLKTMGWGFIENAYKTLKEMERTNTRINPAEKKD